MAPQPHTPESAADAPIPPVGAQVQVQPPHATPNQRMGLAVFSLICLLFLLNIVAALAHDFGPAGTAVALAAVCLIVLGVNIAFNFDLLRRH